MFKKDTYEFEPIKELVLTMHFGFIDKLKKGWNHIYNGWLDKLKQHLKNAGNRLIKQIHLKRLTVMILAYLGQTPEVPRTDLRAKHHS